MTTTDNIFTQWTRVALFRQPWINALAVVSFVHNKQLGISHALLSARQYRLRLLLAHQLLSISQRKLVTIDSLFEAAEYMQEMVSSNSALLTIKSIVSLLVE